MAAHEGAPAWAARLRWGQLDAAVARRDGAGVALRADQLTRIATVAPGAEPLAIAAAAWVSVLSGQPDLAAVETAVGALRDAGLGWEASQLAGQAAIRVDDAGAAKALLGRARSLRPPSAARDESDRTVTPAGLSEREAEVGRLVLDGLTHKQIGATLYISPKTVEHHVAHIRQKLVVTNRAEFLAALRDDLASLDS